MTTQHVFWDCDGTLVDSEIIAMAVAIDTLIEHFDDPLSFSPYEREQLIHDWAGMHFDQMIALCAAQYEPVTEAERQEMMHRNHARTLDALSKVDAIFGINTALATIESVGAVNTVVTSSELDRVCISLEAAELRHYFHDADGTERIYSATSTLPVPTPKPDPAIYHYALERAGTDTSSVVAVEDSRSGVRAAVAAGIPVIGFVAGRHVPAARRMAHGAALMEAGAMTVVSSGAHLRAVLLESLQLPPRALA
ncbi:MAG: HAD-IA family hydrolase [Acidimicrobiia bacterium]